MRKAIWVLIIGLCTNPFNAQLPDGFFLEDVVTEVEFPVGVEFIDAGRMLVYNTPGAVYLVEDGELLQDPIIDLREEVGFWGDHGLLSVACHPQFDLNGYIYLYYVVDRHHLLYHGTSEYDPEADISLEATIARLIRLSLNPNTLEIQPGSREVFIGEDISSGVPILGFSHAGGTLVFGSDGTLMLSTGDGTWKEYNGTGTVPEGNYDIQGLEDGIITPEQHTGTWRSQQLDCLNGKILRIDAETGDGLPSNPFYESDNPDSDRSRVWSLGLRNPFRITKRPLTGSSDPMAGDPGSLYIGDVGYWRYEELNVVNGPAINFGWPLYEGIGRLYIFEGLMRDNPYTQNPLSTPGQCPENFSFDDLLNDPIASHNEQFPNPCDALLEIPVDVPHFVHTRPALTWRNAINNAGDNTLIPGFDLEGFAIGVPVEETELAIEPFIGSASLAGDFYFGSEYPEEYFGAYFHTDFAGWMKVFQMTEGDEIESVEQFLELANMVQVKYNPFDEFLYITTIFPGKVMRVAYGGNRPPIIDLEPDTVFGTSPLTVQFDPSGTYDPDGDPLAFEWDLGDGNTSMSNEPFEHQYISPDDEPYVVQATLLVTDTAGNSSTASVFIALNNTPPSVSIDSLPAPSEYDGFNGNSLTLSASVSDQESTMEELEYKWRLYLHHNSHFHLEFESTEQDADFELVGIGCEGLETYWYRIELEVKDPQGLIGKDLRWLYPDCDSTMTEVVIEQDFILYPNPNQGQFTLRGPLSENETVRIELFDSTGRLLTEEDRKVTLEGRLGFSAEGLGEGRYFLRLESSEQAETLPFIIQRP